MPRGGNAPTHQASGGGTVVTELGRSTYAFHASSSADGSVKGSAELHFSSSPITVHATVSCLSVAGNQAWMGAVVTRSPLETGAFSEGGQILWTVIDNGEGNNANPDRVSSFFGTASAQNCQQQFNLATRDWTNGNAQVR